MIDIFLQRLQWLTLTSIILLLILIFIMYLIKYGKKNYGGLLHTKTIRISKYPRGILLGKIPHTPFYLFSPQSAEQHILILGGTGLGKTTSYLLPTLLSWDGPAYVVDVSGDISCNIPGSKFVLSPFDDDNTIKYDVFSAIDKIDNPADQDLELMKLAILLMPEEDQDSSAARYFRKGGLTILQAALICGYHQGLDFVDICKIVRLHSLADLFEMIDADEKASSIISTLKGQSDINLQGCKDQADAAVELFAFNKYVRRSLGRGGVNPRILEQSSLYLVIPISELTACKSLMHIVSAQIISYVLSRKYINTDKQKILLCLDELTALGKLDYLIDLLARSRKNGVRVMALTQSKADLEMIYKKEHRSMLENFGLKIVLSAEERDTQNYLSDLIGDYEVPGGNVKKYYRPVKLSNLGNDAIVLFRGGHIKVRKAPFYENNFNRPPTVATMDRKEIF